MPFSIFLRSRDPSPLVEPLILLFFGGMLKNDPSDEFNGEVILKLNVAEKIKAKIYVNEHDFYHRQ